jgi:hypothetical protein
MAGARCGCALVEQADRAPLGTPEHETEHLRAHGEELRAEWRCGGEPPADADLPEGCRDARAQVAKVIGAELPPGCPMACLRSPVVHRAARAWRWWSKGQLHLIEGDAPPGALCDAVDAVQEGVAAAEAAALDRMKHERERAAATRPPRG